MGKSCWFTRRRGFDGSRARARLAVPALAAWMAASSIERRYQLITFLVHCLLAKSTRQLCELTRSLGAVADTGLRKWCSRDRDDLVIEIALRSTQHDAIIGCRQLALTLAIAIDGRHFAMMKFVRCHDVRSWSGIVGGIPRRLGWLWSRRDKAAPLELDAVPPPAGSSPNRVIRNSRANAYVSKAQRSSL
jgi:hypothetical protein